MGTNGEEPAAGPPVVDPEPQADRTQAVMARLSRILGASTTGTLDTAVEECLEQIGLSVGADVAFAVLVDEHDRISDDWRWVRPGRTAFAPAPGSPMHETFGSTTEILRLGHTVAVDDLATIELSPSEQSLATANGLRSILLAPVRIGPALLGLTGVQVFDEPHHWSRAVTAQLELVAQMLVQAVQRTRDRGALAAADARARRIAEYIPDGLLLLEPSGTIAWVSPAFVRRSGDLGSEHAGRPFLSLIHPDDGSAMSSAMAEQPLGGSGVVVRMEASGGWRWIDASWQLVHDADSAVPDEIVVSLRDVHDQHLRTEQLTQESRRDGLTGTLNRVGLEDALSQLGEGRQRILMAFIDIDRFKAVNDTSGHEAGDAVLRAVADALRAAVRTTDLVARVGGDEFCVVAHCDDHDDNQPTAVSLRLLTAVRAALAHGTPTPAVSIGIAGPAPASAASDLRRAADAAMYRAKRAGGDRCELDDRRPEAQRSRAKYRASSRGLYRYGSISTKPRPS